MKTDRSIRARLALALSGAALAALVVVPASPAAADPGGSCSVSVPSKVSVDSRYERIIGKLGSDCSDSGEDWASWDIRHSYYGLTDLFFFDTAETWAVWGFYDWDHLGTYYVEPGSPYDNDSNELSQNSRTVSVRLASRLALSTSRSGKYVTLKTTASRYPPDADAFRAWEGKRDGHGSS